MIRVGAAHQAANREHAINFVTGVLRTASDWQEGQHALADHPEIGPWLRGTYGDNSISEAQSIIRAAEKRLGKDLPY